MLLNAVAGHAVPPERLKRAWGSLQRSHWQLLLSTVLAIQRDDASQLQRCREVLYGLYKDFR